MMKYDGNKITLEIDVNNLSKKEKWFLDCYMLKSAMFNCGNFSTSFTLSAEDRASVEQRVESNRPEFKFRDE